MSLYRFCLMQMKNPADAEDILQEVFYKRLTQAPAFQSQEHERAWLFRVAVNPCRDEFRKSRRKEVSLELASEATLKPEQRQLLEEVAALPEKQRTVIHLHYYEGYSLQEIADLLGITLSSVKMRMKRGREALRCRLEED